VIIFPEGDVGIFCDAKKSERKPAADCVASFSATIAISLISKTPDVGESETGVGMIAKLSLEFSGWLGEQHTTNSERNKTM
jgi:hypothetical protein